MAVSGQSGAACTPGPTTLCLNGGRFRVTAFYATPDGVSGPGMGVGLTGDSGYFWFFDAANIELVVKVLDACTLGNFWVFAGGLTNVGVTLIRRGHADGRLENVQQSDRHPLRASAGHQGI